MSVQSPAPGLTAVSGPPPTPPQAVAPDAGPSVDAQNPWLGLASFTEETRAWFFGREEEIAELARRVQRKLLTVLFGKSGLGKTSILRAGLVPRLREQRYCPVYVRMDWGREAPEPAEQLKEAIRRAAGQAGRWTRSGVAVAGESLWEFLHHRDDLLQDEAGHALTPFVIFDQFEEVFTLAQADDQGRARAARFIEELADLVENRPPRALEARLEADEHAADAFDFARSDYRVLIALREDYLAPLESLKRSMPSLAQNRLRIAPMSGTQALAAVLKPGRNLVSEEVAAAIVRFVAGGAELANAEVEPSLLSLICRELNDARLARGASEISLDLLAGSHATILSRFYERALADQPPALRQIIEDELLTESGYRENVAEESLLGRFRAAGTGAETLALLVNRRLLRIEERLDVRRVELTHDVLCAVVRESRDRRQARESQEATQRKLDEQRDRELAARRALQRARAVATGGVLLAVIAILAAVFGYLSAQRARRAEQLAQRAQVIADQSRANAEHLVGYLSDDFVRELESFGRLKVIAEFTQRQIDYFHGLPASERSAETVRNAAQALVSHGQALRSLGNTETALGDVREAATLLDGLRAGGDRSEATAVSLARAWTVESAILNNRDEPQGPAVAKRAQSLLEPIATAPGSSAASRRAYVQLLTEITFQGQFVNTDIPGALRAGREAMRIATGLGGGAADTDVEMSAWYAEGGAWLMNAYGNLGRTDEVRKLGAELLPITSRILQQRPGYRLALHARQIILSQLGTVAIDDLDFAAATQAESEDLKTATTLVQLDPSNTVSLNNLGVAFSTLGDLAWHRGRTAEAVDYFRRATEYAAAATAGGTPTFFLAYAVALGDLGYRLGLLGDAAGVRANLTHTRQVLEPLRSRVQMNAFESAALARIERQPLCMVELETDQVEAAANCARPGFEAVSRAQPNGATQRNQRAYGVARNGQLLGRAEYLLKHYDAAVAALRSSLESRRSIATESVSDRREVGELSTWLALALVRQGKLPDARVLIEPVVDMDRQLVARNHDDAWIGQELAAALYVKSLIDPDHRSALLSEAARSLGKVPPAVRNLREGRRWSEWIRAAQAG